LSSSVPTHFSLDLAGIPSNFHVSIDYLPKVTLDILPLTLELKPVDVSFRLKEFPSIRAHVPADFNLAFCILGRELASISLCGEAQVITEPYRPNPCEECGEEKRVPTPGEELG
jgi:hypothetical protein